jgi:DNA-binding beta-propeller fold protein YncE
MKRCLQPPRKQARALPPEREPTTSRPRALALWCVPSLWLALQVSRAFALCGDATGDGRIRATDALLTLRAAVASTYDPELDVFPVDVTDGMLSAPDATLILRAAASATIPMCAAADERVVALTTASCDFATGGVATIDVRSREVLRERPGVTKADAVIRKQGERVFALNRFGGNTVMELDPADDLAPLWTCSVGVGSNPHDIALAAPDKGYVTRYDSTNLAIIDPSAGPSGCDGFLRGTIDLGPWADDDGFPEMDQMALVGDTLFVVLQRLDRDSFFRPRANGAVVAIDTKTNTVTDVIELSIQNPFGETKGLYRDPHNGLLWIAGPGRLFTDLTDGGIERIDPTTRTSLGVLATGAQLGGDLTDLVIVGTSRAYALVAGENFRVSLVEIDLDKGTPVSVLATSDELLSDIEITESGELWLADRNCFRPGVRVFSIADNRETTTEPLGLALAPFTLVFAH